jgi:DNA-binding transcriptional regulator YiaG
MPDLTPETLRAWREARGLTRQDAADLFQTPKATLEGLETGRRPNSALWGPLAVLMQVPMPLLIAVAVRRTAMDAAKPSE